MIARDSSQSMAYDRSGEPDSYIPFIMSVIADMGLEAPSDR